MISMAVSALILPGYLLLLSNIMGKLTSKIDLPALYLISYALEQYFHEVLYVFPKLRHIQGKWRYSQKSLWVIINISGVLRELFRAHKFELIK